MAKNDTLQRAFGVVLRQARHQAKLSQEALALEAGLDRTYISLLERGQRQASLATLFALAKPLQIEPHVFVLQVEDEIRASEEPHPDAAT